MTPLFCRDIVNSMDSRGGGKEIKKLYVVVVVVVIVVTLTFIDPCIASIFAEYN